jgi:hypothetical protein
MAVFLDYVLHFRRYKEKTHNFKFIKIEKFYAPKHGSKNTREASELGFCKTYP